MPSGDFAKQVIKEISVRLTAEPVETPRLLLRPFRDSDLADLYEYLAQKEQQRLAGNSPCDSVDDARMRLEYILRAEHPQAYFAIVLKDENKVIGNLTFNLYPFLEQDEILQTLRGVTLSYILNEKYWRRGLMTELLRAVYPILFEQAGLDYIQSGYFVFNEASAALQRKLGMRLWTEERFVMDGILYETREMILFRDGYECPKTAQNQGNPTKTCRNSG